VVSGSRASCCLSGLSLRLRAGFFVPLMISALKKDRRWGSQQRHERAVGRKAKYAEAVRVDLYQLLVGEP
jgi:hypothetical protein